MNVQHVQISMYTPTSSTSDKSHHIIVKIIGRRGRTKVTVNELRDHRISISHLSLNRLPIIVLEKLYCHRIENSNIFKYHLC